MDTVIDINANALPITNNIFWHIYGMNHWKQIVEEQLSTIINSGLLNKINNIYVTFIGNNQNDIDWLTSIDSKIILDKFDSNPHHYEKLCLHSLLEWSKYNSSNVLYIHSKGVSRPNNENVQNWRRLMEYFLIEQHETCIQKLNEGHDAVGCLLTNGGKSVKIHQENHKYHFSGNFWWSKTDYIRSLPRIPDIDLSQNKNYWLCERWILYYYTSIKVHIMYENKNKHYYNFSP